MDIHTCKVDAKLQPVNMAPWNFVCWESSKDEQHVLRPFMWKTKNMKLEGGWGFKKITHELLYLDKWNLVQ